MRFCKFNGQCILNYFHYLPIQISVVPCAFVSLYWVLGCCHWLFSISWFAARTWSWTHHCHHVVLHWSSLPIKNIMISRKCAPLCRSLVPIQGIEMWGVGLRWDDDEGKSRIVYLGCECGCLRPMMRLSRSWGWDGCIMDSMKWWGIGVQWNGSLMHGLWDIAWGVMCGNELVRRQGE